MGCGASSRNTPVFEIKNHDPLYIEVTAAWEKAWQTIPQANQPKKRLVVKRSGWKTIRVFVSSTFKDFHQEREVLVKKVFPDLRAWCQSRRLHLVECDLRWGVPKDFTTEGTLRACLGEIDRCYQDNIMPFFINMTSERIGWVPAVEEVPEAVSSEYQWIEGLSVTEMEIMHGAYRKDNPNAMFLLRDPSFLNSVPEEYKSAFIDSHELAPYKIDMLRKMIKQRFPTERIVNYYVEFLRYNEERKVPELTGLEKEFSVKVMDFLKKRISDQYPLEDKKMDPFLKMQEAHESFMRSRCDTLVGRHSLVEQITNHLMLPDCDVPFIVCGGPGSGKSSLMAKVASGMVNMASHSQIPGGGGRGWHVFYHFVGAIPDSTELLLVLQRILKEIDAVKESDMPGSLDKAAQTTAGVLANTNSRPTILIIDALNQLDDDICSTLNTWMPRKLGPNVRCVLSMIPNTPSYNNFIGREPAPKMLEVTPLTKEDRKSIVTTLLGQYNKQLDEDQMEALLNKTSSDNPLWLSIACEELRVFGHFRQISDKINHLADGLLELEGEVLSRFEHEGGGDLLVAALCLMEVSVRGLLETELLVMLADDHLLPSKVTEKVDEGSEKALDALLPAYQWAEVYRGLRPFLRPFGDSGEGRLDFYHRSLSKAVRKKYFRLSSGEEKTDVYTWWHRKLAKFFLLSSHNIHRRVEELPCHLIAIKSSHELKEFLTDWEVFDLLYDPDLSAKLLSYWRQAEIFDLMAESYSVAIDNLANLETTSKDLLCQQMEKVAMLLSQGGCHEKGLEIGLRAIALEKEHMGARPQRLANLLMSLGFILDEEMKLAEYMYRSQLPKMRLILEYFIESVELRTKHIETNENNLTCLGRSYNRMAFYYSGYALRGGDDWLSKSSAQEKAIDASNKAIDIFEKMKKEASFADCLTTKGVCYGRSCPEQIKCYEEAYDTIVASVGKVHQYMDRLLLNMAIYHEEMGDYYKAYEKFHSWYEVCMDLYGAQHPKTRRPISTLREPMYRRIAAEKEMSVPDEIPQDTLS